jgi:hypothetical protein
MHGEHGRWLRFSLEHSFCNHVAHENLLGYMEFWTSDETPLVTRHRDHGVVLGEGDAIETATRSVDDFKHALAKRSLGSAIAPTKLLQSHSSFAMLIKMPNGKMIVVNGDGRHCIQVLDTNSGECIAKATEEASGWSSHARNFAKRWRVLCTDGAGSNARALQHVCRKDLRMLAIAYTCYAKLTSPTTSIRGPW